MWAAAAIGRTGKSCTRRTAQGGLSPCQYGRSVQDIPSLLWVGRGKGILKKPDFVTEMRHVITEVQASATRGAPRRSLI